MRKEFTAKQFNELRKVRKDLSPYLFTKIVSDLEFNFYEYATSPFKFFTVDSAFEQVKRDIKNFKVVNSENFLRDVKSFKLYISSDAKYDMLKGFLDKSTDNYVYNLKALENYKDLEENKMIAELNIKEEFQMNICSIIEHYARSVFGNMEKIYTDSDSGKVALLLNY